MLRNQVPNYRLVEQIGAGGMGEVYLAEDLRLKRRVAIKVLPTELLANAEYRQRFQREAEALASLDHPNIAVIHEIGEVDGRPFLCMQYLRGETLRERIRRGPLPTAEWLGIGAAIAEGLDHAHRHGVVHRDLKPANVILTPEGQVKIVDFGLAKIVGAEPSAATRADGGESEVDDLTRAGGMVGTVAYMSPEQARGEPLDHRSDLFSLGILLYEMASGERPFRGGNEFVVLHEIIRSEPPSLSMAAPEVPSGPRRLIERALKQEPEHRYQSGGELASDLRDLRRSLAGTASQAPRRPLGGRSRWAVLALGVALVGLLAWLLSSFPDTEDSTPDATDEPPAIAVMGFHNLSDPGDNEQLSRMLMSLVTTDLSETGGLPVVSVSKVLSARRRVSGAGSDFDPALASETAKIAGAEVMLVGQIGRAGSELLLTVELVDVESGRSLGSQQQRGSSAAELFTVAGALADGCRSQLGVVRETGTFDLAKALTSSPEAYREYTMGETALHRFEIGAAVEHFERAIVEDPTFALAYLRSATAAAWSPGATAAAVFERGLPYVGRLPVPWQTVYHAYANYIDLNYDAVWSALEPLTTSGVQVPDAYYLQGEVTFHATRYLDPRRGRQLFERTLDIDPSFRVVFFHLVDNYIAGGDFAAARRAIERYRSGDDADPTIIEAEAQLLAAEGRIAEAIAKLEPLWNHPERIGSLRLAHLLLIDGEWQRAIEVAEHRMASGAGSYTSRGTRALAYVGQGRLRDGLAELRTAAKAERSNLFLASELLRFRARVLEAAGDSAAALAAAQEAIEVDPHWPAARYTRGRLLLGLERTEEAVQALADLRTLNGSAVTPIGRFWEHLLEAELRLAEGRLVAARDAFGRASAMAREHREPIAEWAFAARLEIADGDTERALAAYERLLEPQSQLPWAEVVEPTLALYEAGRLEDALGHADRALEHYRLFLDRWGSSDLPIGAVSDAMQRVRALGS